MIGAPRLRAASSCSRIRIPAPSPMTKPSRSRSKGRLASCGSTWRGETAREAQKAAGARGVTQAPLPHAIMAVAALASREHRKLDESRHAARLFAVEPGLRLEIDDLTRDLARHPGRIERLDAAHTGSTRLDRLPRFAGGVPQRGDGAGPGDDDPRAV